MTRLLLALTLFLLPSSVTAQVESAPRDSLGLKLGIVTLGALGGGDIATTAQAAERGNFYEANIVFRKLFDEPALLGLANGALTTSIIYTIVQWHRSENSAKRLVAHILLPTWIMFRGYVVYRNWDLLRRP